MATLSGNAPSSGEQNVDLAMQVQSLLQRQCVELAGDMVLFNNIMSLQQLN